MKSMWRRSAVMLIVLLVFLTIILRQKSARTTSNDLVALKKRFMNYMKAGFKYCRNYTRYDSGILEDNLVNIHRPKAFIENKVRIILTDPIKESFSDSVNQLTDRVQNDGTDYLLITNRDTFKSLKEIKWQRKFIHILTNHVVSNIGIVVPANSDDNEVHQKQFLFVHMSHFNIFGLFFPQNQGYKSAIHWIKDVYSPFHVTELNIMKLKDYEFESIEYKVGENIDNSSLQNDKKRLNDYIYHKTPIFVVSYSLYGSSSRYTDGAEANVNLARTIYSNWKIWIFHDNSVPIPILFKLCVQNHVTCINMTGSVLKSKMSWRFLVASVPFIARYIVRDIDARLFWRERAAVIEWILSLKHFHVMRDHPAHSPSSILGGMWGGTRDAVPNMEKLLLGSTLTDSRGQDMHFLNENIWPIAVNSLFQHDSFSCEKFGGGFSFPNQRIGVEHVGSTHVNHKMREGNLIRLRRTPVNKKCTCISVAI